MAFTAFLLSALGVTTLVRRLLFRFAVTILVYHDPQPVTFNAHLEFLRKRYRIIDIDSALQALADDDVARLGPYPLVITIDDGHRGNLQLLPVIRRHGVRPCIYLCSRIVATQRPFADILVSELYPKRLNEFKRQSEASKRDMFRNLCGIELETELDVSVALSLEDLLELQPWVTFGSHGRFHQSMPFLEDGELENEICGSKADIESMLGVECRHFAFPSGHHDVRSTQAVRRCGFLSARTTQPGGNRRSSDRYALRVTGASDDADLRKLDVQSVGIFRILRSLALVIIGSWRKV